jgi:SAM-dependent methyltransferase
MERYARSPSIALCRVPEVELLSSIALRPPVLDHCCGDGFIASLAYPGTKLEAGVDIDSGSVRKAMQRGGYRRVECSDVGVRLPFEDASFATAINNSGIEHVKHLASALRELARVLRPGGRLHFNVLNRRYFDAWPLDQTTQRAYREWQPFYHAFDEQEWTEQLIDAGFRDVMFSDYFEPGVGRVLARLDYEFSAFYLRRRWSWSAFASAVLPRGIVRRWWAAKIAGLSWSAGRTQGCGFLISATR